ncbi:DUF2207 domain-containing protein [Companilactobacillus furfuricola]|uniref:DUF2207 domain-containing protein n=1 Tax=Companilactobacillus furfuricola TaxID=1462575 RepID=UPI000F7B6EC9|nr:DUF2207 domain-containing protein [Companilactobacillus furfuricola]
MFYDGKNELPLHYGSGDDNTYDTMAGHGLVAIGVYHTINDGFASARYNYHVKNFVVNYNDVAEVNWRLIDSDWKMSFKRISVTYHLPTGANKDIYAYEKGLAKYNIQIDHNRSKVSFVAHKVSAQQLFETRILFPNTVTYNNKNQIKKNAKTKIIHQEQQYDRQQTLKHVIFYTMGVFFILIIISWYYTLFRNIYRNPYQKNYPISEYLHWFTTPKLGPTMTKLLLRNQTLADFSCFVSELLVQIDRGKLQIKRNGKIIEIKRIAPIHDKFINYLLNEVGDSQQVKSTDIQNFSDDQLYVEYHNWLIRASNGKNRFIEPISINHRHSLANISLFTSFFAVLVLILAAFLNPGVIFTVAFISLGILICSWLAFGLINRYSKCMTDSGKESISQLKAFDLILTDPEKIIESITHGNITKSNILPYVIALHKQEIIDLDIFKVDKENLALLVGAFQNNPVFNKHRINI